MELPPAADWPTGTVVDVGCGYGPIAITARHAASPGARGVGGRRERAGAGPDARQRRRRPGVDGRRSSHPTRCPTTCGVGADRVEPADPDRQGGAARRCCDGWLGRLTDDGRGLAGRPEAPRRRLARRLADRERPRRRAGPLPPGLPHPPRPLTVRPYGPFSCHAPFRTTRPDQRRRTGSTCRRSRPGGRSMRREVIEQHRRGRRTATANARPRRRLDLDPDRVPDPLDVGRRGLTADQHDGRGRWEPEQLPPRAASAAATRAGSA